MTQFMRILRDPAPVIDPPAPIDPPPVVDPPPAAAVLDWHGHLGTDLKGSPLISKFENTPDGLKKAMESYGNLEKLLGHEKVPIPKDEKDTEGWNRWMKAMGVPDKPTGYALEDAKLPETLKGMMMNKDQFASFLHAQRATPAQARALWNQYQMENIKAYNTHMDGLQKQLEQSINVLKQEWGGAYDANVEMGQNVVNEFTKDDKEMNDYVTSRLMGDPKGIKFLQKLGQQFAESNVGTFQTNRFSVTPDQAQEELDKMLGDLQGPYFNEGKKFSLKEQDVAVERANKLRAIISQGKRQA